MKLQFLNSSLLWLLPAAALAWFVFLSRPGIWLRAHFLKREAPTVPASYRPAALVLQALAALSLIFAAAGLQYRHATRKIEIVVAADVSPSIYELNAQTARIRELLGALDPDSTEAAVVVFSESAGLEHSMAPLPAPAPSSGGAKESRGEMSVAARSRMLPDLQHLNAVLKTNGTDIGGALQFSRGAFTSADSSRAILLLSDFRDTRMLNNRSAAKSAAFLNGSGIELLATPVILGASSDVQLAEFRVPESAVVGRAVPLEITLTSQQPQSVVVSVRKRALGRQPVFVDSKTIELSAAKDAAGGELRKTIRLFDHPTAPGVAIYTARITGPNGAPIPGDVNIDNNLSAAVPVSGPSKWAVLTRRDSTLAALANDPAKPLGVEAKIFFSDRLPTEAAAYEPFAGILVDGLSATELPDTSAALHALAQAADQGKALVALGGETAFGAGQHPRDGAWERVLPIEMTPEDDRARAILFVIDVSKSMDDKVLINGQKIRKMDYAAEQLQVVNKLRPQDRLGMIEFSGDAKLAAPFTNEPLHIAFLNAVHAIRIANQTDFVPALEAAKSALDEDNAEEQLIILISDGVQTVPRQDGEILRAAEKLFPKQGEGEMRRRKLWTFGIGVESDIVSTAGAGEERMKEFARIGGGEYQPNFKKLREIVEIILHEGEQDFFKRTDAFVPRVGQPHALIQNGSAWPSLNFRNRVKSKSGADTILLSGVNTETSGAKKQRVDPLLVLSGPSAAGLGRRAALTLTLDGAEGSKLLAAGSAGRTILSGLLSWAERRGEQAANGITISAEPFGNDELAIELRAFDVQTGEPDSSLKPHALLTVLQNAEDSSGGDSELPPLSLRAIAPGTYRGTMRAPPAAVCRLTVRDGGRTIVERYVSTPCAAEMRRFGVDRAAMAELVAQAGSGARTIESPRDLAQWASEKSGASGLTDLRPWLAGLALVLLFVEYGLRGKRG